MVVSSSHILGTVFLTEVKRVQHRYRVTKIRLKAEMQTRLFHTVRVRGNHNVSRHFYVVIYIIFCCCCLFIFVKMAICIFVCKFLSRYSCCYLGTVAPDNPREQPLRSQNGGGQPPHDVQRMSVCISVSEFDVCVCMCVCKIVKTVNKMG